MGKIKVLVIGENCTDILVYGISERKSPEGNGPVFKSLYEKYSAGMVANTANNLGAMGADVDILTDTGNITKTRYIDETTNELYLRVDDHDSVDRIDLNNLPELSNYDAVVISDYCKGFLSEEDIAKIGSMHELVILDTKKKLGSWCKDINFIKVNRTECNNNLVNIAENDLIGKIIATMDKDGATHNGKVYPATTDTPIDICGAGDTFVAGFTTEYVKNKDIDNAITFANKAAGQVILQKRLYLYSIRNYIDNNE
jgi:bifunctional ADP-heptose synthase (sugar kinase/adenylyltransferase)